ncbi:hypothetical protein [Myxosarcina sp. GI1(2024)]
MAAEEQPKYINREQDQFDKDLNPNPMAGRNIGPEAYQSGRFERTARDIDELQQKLEGFSNDELGQIPILKPGTRLKQGATYINLNDPARREFTAMGDMEADENNLFVPKDEVGYLIWNRLIGAEK